MLLFPKKKPNSKATNFQDVLLESSHNIIFVKDRYSRILYGNKAFLGLYPPTERDKVIGAESAENFQEDAAAVFLSEDRKAFENGYSEIVEEIQDYARTSSRNGVTSSPSIARSRPAKKK